LYGATDLSQIKQPKPTEGTAEEREVLRKEFTWYVKRNERIENWRAAAMTEISDLVTEAIDEKSLQFPGDPHHSYWWLEDRFGPETLQHLDYSGGLMRVLNFRINADDKFMLWYYQFEELCTFISLSNQLKLALLMSDGKRHEQTQIQLLPQRLMVDVAEGRRRNLNLQEFVLFITNQDNSFWATVGPKDKVEKDHKRVFKVEDYKKNDIVFKLP
jgi:hypothetical protein